MSGFRLVDLSLPLGNDHGLSAPAQVRYIGHQERGELLARKLGVDPEALGCRANATEEFSYLVTHCATHFDAPWHYTDTVDGRPAPTIDQVPLEWCFADGVVLDLTRKKAGEEILVEELKEAAQATGHAIGPGEIVLVRTGTSAFYGQPGCDRMNPGMTREGTLWLADQGVRIVGIDAGCWDRPPALMLEEVKAGVRGKFMQAHRAAGERGLCILEWLTNLDLLPLFGFKVCAFPVKVERGSAGWVRVVAFLEDSAAPA